MKKFFKKNKLGVISAAFIIVAASLILFIGDTPTPKTYTTARRIVVDDKFDLKTVPDGKVMWIHGVPNFREDFTDIDSSLRYSKFDIGIWNMNHGMVYKIRIPYYARGMFQLGMIIKQKKVNQKRNPDNDIYVYPKKKGFYNEI